MFAVVVALFVLPVVPVVFAGFGAAFRFRSARTIYARKQGQFRLSSTTTATQRAQKKKK